MKRTQLQRGSPPKRTAFKRKGVGLVRKTRMRNRRPNTARDIARREAKFRREFLSVARVLWVKALPCCVMTHGTLLLVVCEGPGHNAHRKSRGAGGTWRDIVPLCKFHHDVQHAMGIQTFQYQYGLDLPSIAAKLATLGPQPDS